MRASHWMLPAVLLAGACQPPAPAGLSAADKAAIDSLGPQFAMLANKGDYGALVKAFYADNAVIMPPNTSAKTGPAAIEAFFHTFPPISNFQLRTEEVDGTGDVAYERGRYSMTLTPAGGAAMTDSGKYVTVYRKQKDGSWKATNDIFNSDVPMPTPEMTPKPPAKKPAAKPMGKKKK